MCSPPYSAIITNNEIADAQTKNNEKLLHEAAEHGNEPFELKKNIFLLTECSYKNKIKL